MKHLLIDFENVQPQNLDNLPTDGIHIWLFLGAVHKSLPVSLVKSLLRFGERTHLVQLQKTGKNALDFYLSYYLGQITATDPKPESAYFRATADMMSWSNIFWKPDKPKGLCAWPI